MKLYRYDKITKEYINTINADIDPLETRKQGKNVYLIPANTTDTPPTIKEGYAPIWSTNQWVQIIDNRGKLEIDLSSKAIDTIDYLGEVKEGFMLYDEYIKSEEYEKDKLELARTNKTNENITKRNVEYIPTPLGYLKTSTPLGDLKTVIVLYDKLVEANNGLPEGYVRIYNKEGNVKLSPSITKEEYNNIVTAIVMSYNKIDLYSTYITNKINNATTIEELENIVIDYNNIPDDILKEV